MVSKLRDYETVERALELAAKSLVLAGMDMYDAASVICALQNRGIEPYKISENLKLVLSQRSVRSICEKCKRSVKIKPGVLKSMGVEPKMIKEGTFSKGHGCIECHGTGFRGRVFIFEILAVNDSIRELILSPAHTGLIKKVAMEQGMMTLRQSGIQAVLKGLTTCGEVTRVTEAD
jgi:type IV pilus assembly protein PilB